MLKAARLTGRDYGAALMIFFRMEAHLGASQTSSKSSSVSSTTSPTAFWPSYLAAAMFSTFDRLFAKTINGSAPGSPHVATSATQSIKPVTGLAVARRKEKPGRVVGIQGESSSRSLEGHCGFPRLLHSRA